MNEQMVEAHEVLDLKALYDDEGNLIPNPTQEDFEKFSQDGVDLASMDDEDKVDVTNTAH